jgi:hypothetical protein
MQGRGIRSVVRRGWEVGGRDYGRGRASRARDAWVLEDGR